MSEDRKRKKQLTYLIIVLVGIFVTVSLGVPLSVGLYAKSKVSAHLEKPVSFSDIAFTESGDVCIGFREKGTSLKLIRYYYTVPKGSIRVRISGSDLMIRVDKEPHRSAPPEPKK